MLECTEKCIFQIEGVCTKTNCTGAVFDSKICPFYRSAIQKLDKVKDTVDRNDLYI